MDAGVARPAMAASYHALSAAAGRLDDGDLACWSRCLGWTRADVLFHTLLAAQQALVAFATAAVGEPDVDFITYWKPFQPGEAGSTEHARFVRRAATAYPSDLQIARQWTDTAAAAVHAASALPSAMNVSTQGHVLTIGDFLATLAVEATIHHLDLLTSGDQSGPSAEGLAAVRKTLDGILGRPVPAPWDDATYALKGTGRSELTLRDQSDLGALAARFPLLG